MINDSGPQFEGAESKKSLRREGVKLCHLSVYSSAHATSSWATRSQLLFRSDEERGSHSQRNSEEEHVQQHPRLHMSDARRSPISLSGGL